MWLNHTANYKYQNNEAVKKAEEQLQSELNELKREIETNELVYGLGFTRPFSSVPLPKDGQILAKERKLYLEKMLQVHDIRKPYIQADIIEEQNTIRDEYTSESLPLILQQFFLDRISWNVQAKHAHLLRWKRFTEHTSIAEDFYVDFKNRIGYILSDYGDCVQRARRLSQARELLLTTNSSALAMNVIETEDVEIYLRWLMSHFYSQKTFQHATKILQWLPYEIFLDLNSSNPMLNRTAESQLLTSRQKISNINNTLESFRQSDTARNPSSIGSFLSNKFKMLDNIYLPSSNAQVPRDEILNTISFSNLNKKIQDKFIKFFKQVFNQDEMPVHDNSLDYLKPRLRFFINFYKIDYNLSRMQTSGDEMELFAAVNRKYRHLFAQQEHMKTFRTYDNVELGSENWGADSNIHALKKESNWIQFNQLVPQKDSIYEKEIAKLAQKHFIDQYLISHNSFLEINNDERVQEALRENSTLVKNQPDLDSIPITKSMFQFNSNIIWKKIFHSQNLDMQSEKPSENLDLTNNAVQAPRPISFRSKTNRKLDEFSFTENLQKLGLDDSKSSSQNLSNVQGSYLSFLLLRHLRLRDLKRQALGFLNFFRSIEKTLTIYDGGLSLESTNYKRTSAQNYAKETPYGGNLGNHAYIFNSPKDFREHDFMEFSEIENHDDFYSVDEKGFVHVQDQRGYFIMYDAAMKDFKKLEKDLLMIASYYIAKDKESFDSKSKNQEDTINVGLYSHQNVDRFSVLLDIWTNEVNFLEMKKNLMDIYFEIYQNVFDKIEKRNIAQVITNIMHQRARFDLHANYFTQSYRLEVSILDKQCRIVKVIMDKMIDQMRNYLEKVKDSSFGLPLSVIKKRPINLTSNVYGHTLKNLFMLEFHPCLASASRLHPAFRQSIEELIYFKSVQNITERLLIEQNFYKIYLNKLEKLDQPGSGFVAQIQKEIFNGTFIEDPILVCDFVQQGLKQEEEKAKHKTRKEQGEIILKFLSNLLEMITLRQRLISTSFETEVLSSQYRRMAVELGFEEFHMYLRYIQFDFAKYKENADDGPPVFVNELSNDDSQFDRYVPNSLYLAINELEEGQIGRLSFKAKENVQHVMRPGGLENLQLIVKLQLLQNNALICAIMQVNACLLNSNLAFRNSKNSLGLNNPGSLVDEDKYNENSMFDIKQFMGISSSTIENPTSIRIANPISRLKKYSEAFVSIQLEKNPYRDRMLNEYLIQKESKGVLLSNPSELEKLKRNLMIDYANNFNQRCIQYSLRAQLMTLYYSITKILENFPNTRDNHFVFGEPNEKRNQMNTRQLELDDSSKKKSQITDETIDYINADPRTFKKRPRKLLSDDGERVLNLWFIPHYTDLILLYKKNCTNEQSVKALKHSVRIMSAFNDILNYWYANACMNIAANTSAATDSSIASVRKKIDFSSWENSGGLDTELNELQLEMNQLSDPCDPFQVAELLEIKRSSMILQYDCAIRFAVRDIFLANGNFEAFKKVDENMHFALKFLNEYPIDTDENVYLNIPEPFDCRDEQSSELFPWRTFITKYGPFPMKYFQWYMIEPNVTMCLTGLKEIEKNTANGEILGVTLLMEDLLNFSSFDETDLFEAILPSNESSEPQSDNQSQRNSLTNPDIQSTIKKNPNLITNYQKWRYFLLTWKRLELLKLDWARRKLFMEYINTPELYMQFCENYKKEVLVPVLKYLVRKNDTKSFYDNLVDFKQPILLPQNVSELESKIKQLLRLFEKLELSMIDETVQRIQKELKLVLSERARDENTLTTDLWKKTVMKEEFTINKPHIANEFAQSFFNLAKSEEIKVGNGNETRLVYSIDELNLKDCLTRLGTLIQEREKSNYEQYALYYENLLRQQHQQLYNKEREIVSLKDKIEAKKNEMNIEVECQMADVCYEIIMEITALRAKMSEVISSKDKMEVELRHKVKKEFIDLVTDLVNVNTNLKSQLDLFKEQIHQDVLELMIEREQQALQEIQILKDKQAKNCSIFLSASQQKQTELIRELQNDRHELALILIAQKTLNKLKENASLNTFNKKLGEITENSDKIKQQEIDNKLQSDLKQTILNQQKLALKRQLYKMDIQYANLKQKLEKELREKQNKEHELQQKMKNELNLNSAKKSNVEKLFQELEAKDVELRNLHMVTEKSTKFQSIYGTKIQKEISQLRRSLLQERNLKLDAFQKVDELQSHVYDLEDNMVNATSSRPQTTISKASRLNLTSSMSNVQSIMAKNSSPFPKLNTIHGSTLINRPKTTVGKYRINEIDELIEDDSSEFYQETVLRLKESRLKSAKS